MNSNLHLRKVATIIACLAATTMFVNAQTGTYTGDATVKETLYFNINETVNGISVNLTSSTGGFYELSVSNLQISDINVPTLVLDNVTLTGSGGTYTLSRTGSVQSTIPTMTIPAGVPYVGGMTFNNVPVETTLTHGQIANNVMTLNLQVKITLPGAMSLTTTFLVGFTGTLNTATHPPLGGGTGTSSNPYRIETPAHLKTLADFVNANTANGDATAGVYYIVINDLDLSAYAVGAGWNPIGYYDMVTFDYSYFKGNFNGNGKKVTHLKIYRPTVDFQGLFGCTNGAVIKNLGVENCEITGYQSVGGLVGYIINSSTISNCYATGNLSGTFWVGGLVGDNYDNSTISNCYATGKVSGTNDVGGLVGDSYYSTISNCYATGKVSGAGNYVGGLAGENRSSTISNCYATGKVSGYNYVGGLAGDNTSSSTIKNCIAANDSVVLTANTTKINRICGYINGTFQNNYALSTMVVKNSSGIIPITDGLNTEAGISKALADLQSMAFYTTAGNWNTAAWDFTTGTGVWSICDGSSYPWLQWQNINCLADMFCGGNGTAVSPYQICTAAELKNLADFVNSSGSTHTIGIYYKLMNDINLSAYGSTYNGGKGWNPIGNQDNPFQGNFEGNNHKITNLYINDATLMRGGLFGFILEGTVKNTGVENGNIKGDQLIGGIAGGLDYGDVTGCYFNGSVSGKNIVGGVVSGTENGNIRSNGQKVG